MKLKVFNKLGTGYFFVEVESTRDIEVVAEDGFKFEYVAEDGFKFEYVAEEFKCEYLTY